MRLLRLSANMPTFRTVVFNRSGLSLIVAEHRSTNASKTNTYNGVGKSLMLELIHFCLGSNANKAFQKHLKGWVFSLEFESDGQNHVISRGAENPNKDLSLDDEVISLTDLRKFLAAACFDIPTNVKSLSFRSLFNRFVRSGREAYTSFFFADGPERSKPYEAMLRNAFLLGLDLHLAQRKHDLRKRQEKLREVIGQLENDPLFADIFSDDKVDIELVALREQADKLRRDIQSFRVAEDYYSIEQEANSIKRDLDRLRREKIKLENALVQIDRSMQTRADLPEQRVYDLYAEVQQALPEKLTRRIDDVLDFQRELQQRRVFRLTRERQELDRQRRQADLLISERSDDLNRKLRYLSEHRALDEYVAVSNELAELQQRIAKLEESKNLRDRVGKELRRIDLDLADQNIVTDEYIDAASPLIAEATTTFRGFARELYGSRPSGLVISNDGGENQQRYKIDAHISADAAEGINEAKIFCYDLTILHLQRGHRIQFLAHDSTLFGPVDPRQRLTMFRIVERSSQDLGMQYIATLNLHDITSLRQTEVETEEFERMFSEPSVVLRLTDESPASKLLGIDLDMNYME